MESARPAIRVLAAADLARAVPMARAIELVRDAFAQLARGQAVVPLRTAVEVPDPQAGGVAGVSLFMPAYLPASRSLTVKAVSVFPRNVERGLPTVNALVVAIDPETGRPAAVIDGTYLTTLRTGAATGAATDLLARPDAHSLAIFGAGGQAWHQVEAVLTVRPIREVRVVARRRERAEAFAARVRAERPGLEVRVTANAAEAVRGADVVVTATNSAVPVFDGAHLASGAHVNAIGAFTPEMRELDETTITRGRVFVDQRAACLAEAGDILIPLRAGRVTEAVIQAELGELAAGLHPGRRSADEITTFKSVGNAVQDAAVARFAIDEAERLDLGTRLEL